jgi:hypothetical protein
VLVSAFSKHPLNLLLLAIAGMVLAGCAAQTASSGKTPPDVFLDGDSGDFAVFYIEETCWPGQPTPCYDYELGNDLMIIGAQAHPGGTLSIRFDLPYPSAVTVTLRGNTYDSPAIQSWDLTPDLEGTMDFTLPDDLQPGDHAVVMEAAWATPAGGKATYHAGIIIGQ